MPLESTNELAALEAHLTHRAADARRRPEGLDDLRGDVFTELPIRAEAVDQNASGFTHLAQAYAPKQNWPQKRPV
jgi:hypothetical protein